jgi:hypothetical protein
MVLPCGTLVVCFVFDGGMVLVCFVLNALDTINWVVAVSS